MKIVNMTLLMCCLTGCINKETKERATEKQSNISTRDKDFIENYKTKYTDGRISEIRSIKSYNFLLDTTGKNGSDELLQVVIEWQKYSAVVSNIEGSSIGQLETNDMVGGSVDVNQRAKSSSDKFFKMSKDYFKENAKLLTKINSIPNRDENSVSFDFITNKGTFTIQEDLKFVESGKSKASDYFKEAKKIRAELEKYNNDPPIDPKIVKDFEDDKKAKQD